MQSGADALIVSNHGGRQLDGAQSSISALPEVVRTVGDRIEVLMDGGVRSGQDVIKALALGAKGVMIGRAYIYGLGAMGQAGVTMSLDIIRKELDMTMALCGLRDVTRGRLQHPPAAQPLARQPLILAPWSWRLQALLGRVSDDAQCRDAQTG